MRARNFGSAWEALAPAKLNLYLHVAGRRPDGFHEVETLMAPVRIYDRLRWTPPAPGEEPRQFSLCYDASTPPAYQAAAPPDDRNLVVRAAQALARAAGVKPWGRMTLAKRIPPAAGMGGGSSDAAAALVLANEAWGIHYPYARLAELAATLGSDVPFFLVGQSAVCRGRGERVEPVRDMPRLDVVVVKPPFGLSTAEVYRALDSLGECSPARPGVLVKSAQMPAALMGATTGGRWRWRPAALAGIPLGNGLQAAAASLCDWFERIGAVFDRLSCLGHQMTGSGSAYFGVMRSARDAQRAAGMLSSRNLGTVFAAATCR
jgi:4-diphosphocytidyl-2-C-methyl-D-erythritol kinase